jgi:hypothetical protein
MIAHPHGPCGDDVDDDEWADDPEFLENIK